MNIVSDKRFLIGVAVGVGLAMFVIPRFTGGGQKARHGGKGRGQAQGN